MITDVLVQLSGLKRKIPEEELDVDIAVEAAIESVDRQVTPEERAEVESLMPEWLEEDQ